MTPIIGITLSMEVNDNYYLLHSDSSSAISRVGGLPFMLSYDYSKQDIAQIAETIDGLVTTGGDDIDPTLFGEEPHPNLGPVVAARDHFEIAITQKMLELDKPILGICRGAQILNIAGGGDMYQDIGEQVDRDLLQHNQKSSKAHSTHYVDVVEDSLLYRITNQEKIRVNSAHHQANRAVVNDLQICGTASDGIIEAIESKCHRFALGVQWHPESMLSDNDAISLKIYQAFIKACQQ